MMVFLDILLRVVPGTPGAGHGNAEEEAGHDRPDEQSAERLFPERGHATNDEDDRKERRQDHLAERGLGHDIDALAVVGSVGAGEDSRVRRELPAHLTDDGARGPPDRRP